ncbi:SDR family NAD(P)-dependent oxidoreductase [Desulforhabdus sp. TSK]|uniref:SDR family NAD(P)-dependent oxidoreductase n=1 Tax=Desulforhabdus sp. TSK TaxID=2925014 RepID=UPI001FC845CA|nr:SDR family NAD(P)-dependent oxidoreductase [Desulforhabdus sp. TSK]GKT07142.1 beta-ketoacyl-ACP reductase [Desulforhabdus sp. TSK]
MRLSGKKALVTGASRGIGRSVALGYAREGADLFLTAREDKEGLAKTVEDARAFGVKAAGGLYNAASLEDVSRLMDDVQSKMGGLDVLVNNAGIIRPTPFLEISPEQFEKTVRTHLFGTFYHTQEAVRRFMIPAKSGKIINLSAPAALRGSYGVVDYASAKGGIAAFTRNVAKELAPLNIQVNAVVPVAKTRMTEALAVYYAGEFGAEAGKRLEELSDTERLVGIFVYFACADSDYVTGQVVAADGGML